MMVHGYWVEVEFVDLGRQLMDVQVRVDALSARSVKDGTLLATHVAKAARDIFKQGPLEQSPKEAEAMFARLIGKLVEDGDIGEGGPRWRHSCRECNFLGTCDKYDLYACPARGKPRVIARYGNAFGALLSVPMDLQLEDDGQEDTQALLEAQRRALRVRSHAAQLN